MEIEPGPGPQPSGPEGSNKVLNFSGLVSETLNLWVRKLPQYLLIAGATGLLFMLVEVFILISIFGIYGIVLVEFIGTSPLSTIFNFLSLTYSTDIVIVVTILSFLSLIVYAVVGGAAIDYAFDDYENPGSASVGESFSFAVSRAVHLIAVQFIQSMIIVPVGIVVIILLYIDPLISLALMGFLLYIAVRLGPSVAVVITEEKSAIPALKRSWQITGGLFWHVFAGQILMGIISIILSLILAIIVGIGLVFLIPDVDIAAAIGTIAATLLLSAISYIFQAVLYKDLESRGTTGKLDWWLE